MKKVLCILAVISLIIVVVLIFASGKENNNNTSLNSEISQNISNSNEDYFIWYTGDEINELT